MLGFQSANSFIIGCIFGNCKIGLIDETGTQLKAGSPLSLIPTDTWLIDFVIYIIINITLTEGWKEQYILIAHLLNTSPGSILGILKKWGTTASLKSADNFLENLMVMSWYFLIDYFDNHLYIYDYTRWGQVRVQQKYLLFSKPVPAIVDAARIYHHHCLERWTESWSCWSNPSSPDCGRSGKLYLQIASIKQLMFSWD